MKEQGKNVTITDVNRAYDEATGKLASEQAEEAKPSWIKRAEDAAKSRDAVPLAAIKRKRIIPLHNWVLIKKVETKDKLSDGGMVLTEGQARHSTGIVTEVSLDLIGTVAVGDMVIFTNFSMELEDLEELTGEKSLHLVRYEELYGKVVDVEEVCST